MYYSYINTKCYLIVFYGYYKQLTISAPPVWIIRISFLLLGRVQKRKVRTCSCFVHGVGIAGSFLGQARQLPGTVCGGWFGSQKNSHRLLLCIRSLFLFFFYFLSNCCSALPLQNHRTTTSSSSSSSSFLCCNTEQRVGVRTEGESSFFFLSRVRTGSCVLLLFFLSYAE